MKLSQIVNAVKPFWIVGLDLSLTATGWAVIQRDSPHPLLVASGVIKPKATTGPARLSYIRNEILRCLVWRTQSDEQAVVIEDYAYSAHQNSRSTTGLAELRGVITLSFWERGLAYEVVAPNTWRKAVLGKNMPKEEVSKEAWKRFGLEFEDLNTTEAYCIARYKAMMVSG